MIRQGPWLGLTVTMLDIQTGLSESPTRHDKKLFELLFNNKIIIFVNEVLFLLLEKYFYIDSRPSIRIKAGLAVFKSTTFGQLMSAGNRTNMESPAKKWKETNVRTAGRIINRPQEKTATFLFSMAAILKILFQPITIAPQSVLHWWK